uniref:Innexin n=1 Tax=Ditylenchus dipsaci TaxID=166011 RepID=A0A915CUU2_9BILA
MFIFRVMNAVPYSNQPIVQDVIACLHSYFTCNLLIGLAILHSYKQFGGRPIECMTPLGFNSAWNEYTENYCFSSSTYYVSFNEQIVDLTSDQIPPQTEEEKLETSQSSAILEHEVFVVLCIFHISPQQIAFLVNVVCQVSFLNRYLFSEKKQGFGFNVWSDLLNGHTSWNESGLFPRVTWCDFEVREMGQTQNHTVQCVLLLNVFTEKVFIVLWGWYVILASITLCNLSTWIFNFMNPRSLEHFVYNHLEMSGERVFANSSDKGLQAIQEQVARFIDKYLRTDGIFILRLIAQHADVVFTTDLIYKLWESHYSIEKQREALRLTEQKWQEHLRRFDAIEERMSRPESGAGAGIYEDGKALSKSLPFQAAIIVPPDLTDQLMRSPPNHYAKHNDTTSFVTSRNTSRNPSLTTSPTKNRSRRASYAKIKSMRRTLSAESLGDDQSAKGKYIDSSDEDEQPKSGQMSKK